MFNQAFRFLARLDPRVKGWLGGAALFWVSFPALAGTFTADFNTDPSVILNFCGTLWNGSSTTRVGSANWWPTGGAGPFGNTATGPVSSVNGDGFLQLMMASVQGIPTSYVCGGVLFDDLDPGLVVAGFTFECDLRIGNGQPKPADGFSINYVRNNDPILVALNAGDTLPQMNNQVSPNGGQFSDNGNSGDVSLVEEGTQTGVSIGFDMWDSGAYQTSSSAGKEAPGLIRDSVGLDIRVDGVLVATIPMPNGTAQTTFDPQTGAALGNSDPNGNNAATDPSAIETGAYDGSYTDATLRWVHFKADLSTAGVLNVWYKNTQILTNLQTSFYPSPARLLMAARAGGNTANIEVDNIQITTVPASGPVLTGVTATPSYVDLALSDQGSITVNPNEPISLTLDGAAVASPSSISYLNNTTTLHYANPADTYFLMGSRHSLGLVFTDSNGATANVNRTFTVAGYPFQAVSQSNYTWEAPDFNFEGGHFIDAVVLSMTAGPNNYVNQVGIPNIDEYDPSEGGATHAYRAYNPATGSGEIVGTQPVGPAELALRSAPGGKYDPSLTGNPAIVPYNVGWVDAGEWYNYTRTFPSGNFKIYCRLADGTANSFNAQISQVLSDPTAANQAVCVLGTVPGIPTRGWQNYQFFPLVDAFGNEVVLPFGGEETLRFTALSGGRANYFLNAEFFSLVPATVAGNLTPYVAMVLPAAGATGVNPAAVINVDIANRVTSVNPSTIVLQVNATTVAPSQTPVGISGSGGVVLTYNRYGETGALYPLGSTNTVTLTYQDTVGTAFSNQWSFVVVSLGAISYTMPAAYALPADSGQAAGWTARVLQVSQNAAHIDTLAWSEAILAGAFPGIASGTDTPLGINYDQSASSYGFIPGDKGFISTFGLAGGNNFAMEAIAYLALSPGLYTFAVNSDDGFRVTTGAHVHDQANLPGALYDGARAAGTPSVWTFLVQANGLYPFRLTYFQGGGPFSCEFYSIDDQGQKHLIGDTSDPLAIKAYRFSSALPANPIQITQQPPAAVSVEADTPLVLSVSASAAGDNPDLLLCDWSLAGTHVAYGNTLTIPYATAGDAGPYTCTFSYLGYPQQPASVSVNVTVTPDVTPPFVKQLAGSSSRAGVVITFDAPVDVGTATTLGNYSIDGGLTITAATLSTDGTQVTLSTSQQTPGATYQVTIHGVMDTAGNLIMANTTADFTSNVFIPGLVLDEFFDNIFGTAVSALTGAASYQSDRPTRVYFRTAFTTPTWENGDNYGERMTALVTAPTTGNYIFWIDSDDQSELWLSTDDNPANVKLIAKETLWSNQGQFIYSSGGSDLAAKRSDRFAGTHWPTGNTIMLEAGKPYFLMVLHKEGGGGDGVAVGWTLPGQSDSSIAVVPGWASGSYVTPDPAALSILQQPVGTSIIALNPNTVTDSSSGFILTVNGLGFASGSTVRWNGVPLPTTFVSSGQLTAPVTQGDLPGPSELATIPVTVANPDGSLTPPVIFTVVHANVTSVQSAAIAAGAAGAASTAPTSAGLAGVSASATDSTSALTVTAANYASNPTSGTFFDVGGGYVDLQVSGADANASVTTHFYYPSSITGAVEDSLQLLYNTGSGWAPVLSSGGAAPIQNKTDNVDGTVSGGDFTVVFDGTSTPTVTGLAGNVFSFADRTQPLVNQILGPTTPVPVGVPATLSIQFTATGLLSAQQLTVTWGDGTLTSFTPIAAGTATASHTYSTAGTFSAKVTLMPTDTPNPPSASAFVTLTISKGTPVIVWSNPPDIVYGTPLDDTQLNATASVPGTFAYTPAPGAILNAGSGQTLSVTFTPTDSANYTIATGSVSINVLKATPAITWGRPADIVYRAPLGSAQLNATADVPGTFAYNPAAGTVLNAGAGQTLSVSFVPIDAVNYNVATASVLLNVLQATPVITWVNPADILWGTPLSASQLNAVANTPGTFDYTPSAGTILSAGASQTLSVSFTPTDTADYLPATAKVLIDVVANVVVQGPLSIQGRIEGAVQQLAGDAVALDGNATITGDLLAPGTPLVVTNGHPTIQGIVAGTGNVQPASYRITLNGNARLGYLRTRIDPTPMPVVISPPMPAGTRDVSLNRAGQSAGDFSTIRNLTLNGNVGLIPVPPGTYGNLTANGASGFILGAAGSLQPVTYNVQNLTLNGNTRVQLVGPVILALANTFIANGMVGMTDQPLWLQLQLATGGVTLQGGCTLAGLVTTPKGTVAINGNSLLIGAVMCGQLTINGNGVLKGTPGILSPSVLGQNRSRSALAGFVALKPAVTSVSFNWGRGQNTLTFTVPTSAGRIYVLESTEELAARVWTPLQTIVGDGTLKQFTDLEASKPQCYYRVRVE